MNSFARACSTEGREVSLVRLFQKSLRLGNAFLIGFLVTAGVWSSSAYVSFVSPGPGTAALFTAGLALAADLRPEEILTVLPKDAIPAILSPSFDEAGKVSWLNDKVLVIGMEIGGDARAYPVATLSRHEIVNDRVGGVPIAVTW